MSSDIVSIERYNLTSAADWRRISHQDITAFGGEYLLKLYGSIPNLLQHFYPGTFTTITTQIQTPSLEEDWSVLSHQLYNKGQIHLSMVLKKVFPNVELKFNHSEKDMSFSDSNKFMQLDVYIPSLSLAFEYQGIQHFREPPSPTLQYGSLSAQHHRDQQKRDACSKAGTHLETLLFTLATGITLIEIPYWWDR